MPHCWTLLEMLSTTYVYSYIVYILNDGYGYHGILLEDNLVISNINIP